MLIFVPMWKTLNRGLSTKGKGPDVGDVFLALPVCVYTDQWRSNQFCSLKGHF